MDYGPRVYGFEGWRYLIYDNQNKSQFKVKVFAIVRFVWNFMISAPVTTLNQTSTSLLVTFQIQNTFHHKNIHFRLFLISFFSFFMQPYSYLHIRNKEFPWGMCLSLHALNFMCCTPQQTALPQKSLLKLFGFGNWTLFSSFRAGKVHAIYLVFCFIYNIVVVPLRNFNVQFLSCWKSSCQLFSLLFYL